jgi:hypothetical protein
MSNKRPQLKYAVEAVEFNRSVASWWCCLRRPTRRGRSALRVALNSVPVTFVTDSQLIRPFNPVMMHYLDQKGEGKKVHC